MAKNENRNIVMMVCTECKNKTKTTSKNKKNNPERLELNHYCPKCRKSTLHREEKK